MSELTEQVARKAWRHLLLGCDDMITALKDLQRSRESIAEQIHSLRKLGKILRGGSALFGEKKTAARRIQAVGRLLADRRDATSRRKTWEKLHWKPRHSSSRAIAGLLKQQVAAANRKPPKTTIAWCIDCVSDAKTALLAIPESDLPGRLHTGIEKLEKQLAKRSLHVARRGENDFHDLRKSIKALLGACKFLPEISNHPAVTLDHLADILGDENDLATLALWLDRHGFTRQLLPDLWEKLEKSRNRLQTEVLEMLKSDL
ncbi:MAG: CHAD domain-containing protein [Luteolibacter sp.]